MSACQEGYFDISEAVQTNTSCISANRSHLEGKDNSDEKQKRQHVFRILLNPNMSK